MVTLPEDDHLREVKNKLKGNNLWKLFRMKDGQTLWVHRKTRANMYRVYRYIYDKERASGNKGFHYFQEIAINVFGKRKEDVVRPLLLTLCFMEGNLLRVEAFRSLAKGREKPKILQKIFRVLPTGNKDG